MEIKSSTRSMSEWIEKGTQKVLLNSSLQKKMSTEA